MCQNKKYGVRIERKIEYSSVISVIWVIDQGVSHFGSQAKHPLRSLSGPIVFKSEFHYFADCRIQSCIQQSTRFVRVAMPQHAPFYNIRNAILQSVLEHVGARDKPKFSGTQQKIKKILFSLSLYIFFYIDQSDQHHPQRYSDARSRQYLLITNPINAILLSYLFCK